MISEKILKPKFILTWHDLDADRVERSEYVNKRGTDHAGVTNALALAQVIDSNAWPWKIEKVLSDGNRELSMSGWGGEKIV
tara:strand:- start:115 stop:357 length:243 start_codon:yes stop_codon:yes gene_type:complete